MTLRHYPDVPPQADFPALEARVARRWREGRVFERSVERRPAGPDGANEYVFYDGPPFANGLPHFGHLLTGYVKDVVPRYQTLRGRRVERRFGWDCHGLPAEVEAEKELGVSGREAVSAYGIDRFNDTCRSSVLRYTREWQSTMERAGRWVDFENDYKTMDLSYMESVIWAFKELWSKGLVFEDYRVMPYSWAVETPVSNFETRMDDSYREKQDPALTVRFELVPEGEGPPTDLLAWTTTPWTLPSNLALGVGVEIDYALLEVDGRRVVIAEALLERYAAELSGTARLRRIKGAELVGRRYRPLFPFFKERAQEGAFRVLGAGFVDVEEGTGIVHMAPGFGEEDMACCRANGIEVVVPVDDAGRFTDEVPDYAGQHVFDANKQIARDLRERGAVLRHETILHNYPHCWRTGTPLIYRAMSSWYVRVTALKERLLENNRQVNWIPGHIRDGLFGKWLENARDWSISRNRFWGTPLPIWRSDDPNFPRTDIYGSIEALERDFGVRVADLHRPGIDALVRPNPDDPDGRSMMRRVPDVFDCWFESGSMPFAQVHYPFENKAWFENHFPADFIVEYAAQTRGWFYTMFVLATALFDRHPFSNCMCHGVLLARDGQKLSKRLRNYPEPETIFDTLGSDALRWYLVSSPVLSGTELRVEKDGKSIAGAVRSVLGPIWNAWHFFSLYANSDGVQADTSGVPLGQSQNLTVLDRYVLAKTRELVVRVGADLDAYHISGACRAVESYLETLNNWYIRRSRARFWKHEKDADKQAAYDTLGTALRVLCETASPLLPFVTDEIYRGLVGGREAGQASAAGEAASVHLADWPNPESLPGAGELVAEMDTVRAACSTALSMRRSEKVRVRQPLKTLTIAGPGASRLLAYTDVIQDEVNVKTVLLEENIDDFAVPRLKLNARVLGPRLGPAMKAVLSAAAAGDWSKDDAGRVQVAGRTLEAGEFEFRFEPRTGQACKPLPSGELIAVLDFALDDTLVQEGLARDVVRMVQQARRDAGLHVADRIHLGMELPGAYRDAVDAFQDYVKEHTLATRLESAGLGPGERIEAELAGATVALSIEKTAA